MEPGLYSAALVEDLDFIVVPSLGEYAEARARVGHRTPVLVIVGTPDEVAAARAAGADAVLAQGPESPAAGEVDAVLSGSGRARLVTSPQGARSAFASGGDLVVYDLPAMLATVVAGLGSGRPVEPAPSDREPLVLLSGMLCDETLWDGMAERLRDDVLPWPCRIDLDDSVAEMAASVLAQAPPRFALGGHSLGAIVAFEVVRQAPERVTRLMLFNASARGPSPAQQETWERWRTRALDGQLDQIAHELSSPSLGPAAREDATLVEAFLRMARSVGADGFLRQLAAQTTRPDSLGDLGAITVPVLVVSGGADEICPPALQREIADGCDGSDLVTVADGGHMLPLEAPERVADAVRAWLARAEA